MSLSSFAKSLSKWYTFSIRDFKISSIFSLLISLQSSPNIPDVESNPNSL